MSIPFRGIVAFQQVSSVLASIEFYQRLGFTVANTVSEGDGEPPNWASLQSGNTELMIGIAPRGVKGDEQRVSLWMYVDDVAAKRAELIAAAVEVGEINYPFYNPRGEFRLLHPDGYEIWIAHT